MDVFLHHTVLPIVPPYAMPQDLDRLAASFSSFLKRQTLHQNLRNSAFVDLSPRGSWY